MSLDDLDVLDCHRYAPSAQALISRWRTESKHSSHLLSIRARVSHVLCRRRTLDTNPTKTKRATDELPEDLGDSDRQLAPGGTQEIMR